MLGALVHRIRHNGELTVAQYSRLVEMGFNFRATRDPVEVAQEHLSVLALYRTAHGPNTCPSKHDPVEKYARLAAWLERTKRRARSNTLPTAVMALLLAEEIDPTEIKTGRVRTGEISTERSFNANLQVLCAWLDKQPEGRPANLTYKDSQRCRETSKPYRFIEHMVTKARYGYLSEDHRDRLMQLTSRLTINGRSLETVLAPQTSLRAY